MLVSGEGAALFFIIVWNVTVSLSKLATQVLIVGNFVMLNLFLAVLLGAFDPTVHTRWLFAVLTCLPQSLKAADQPGALTELTTVCFVDCVQLKRRFWKPVLLRGREYLSPSTCSVACPIGRRFDMAPF